MKKKILVFMSVLLLSSLSGFAGGPMVDGIAYYPDPEGGATAMVYFVEKCVEEIIIPSVVTDEYCQNCPDYNVTGIEKAAFEGCTELVSITIPESVISIGEYAFADCVNLTSITVLNPVPIDITPSVFEGVDISKCTLNVPTNAVSDYKKAAVWKEFFNVKEDIVVMKDDVAVFRTAIADVDSIIFYNPVSPEVLPSSTEALLIQQADDISTGETLLLDDIRKLFFGDEKLSVEMRNTAPLLYNINDIEKLGFGGVPSSINYPGQDPFQVVAYFTGEGNLIVESPADIQSLTLFDVNGRIIATRNVPVGVYIVRIVSQQGTVVKKLVNNKLNNK